MPTTQALNQLAGSLQVVLDGPTSIQPGQQVRATLQPDPSTLMIVDQVVTQVTTVFVAKNVVFGDKDLEPSLLPQDLNADILAGMPLPPGVGMQGVPGLIGQLTSQITVPRSTAVEVASITW